MYLCPSYESLVFVSLHSEVISDQPRLLSVDELSHHLAESYLTFTLYIQEMLQYKRQNHGKVREVLSNQTFPTDTTRFTKLHFCLLSSVL